MSAKKKKPEPEVPSPPAPKKDFRDAYLNAGFYDENGVAWTENSYTLPNGGGGDTFGPNHPARPAKLDEVRSRNHKALDE